MKNLFILFACFYGAVGFGQDDNCFDNNFNTKVLRKAHDSIFNTVIIPSENNGFWKSENQITIPIQVGPIVVEAASIKMINDLRSCCICLGRFYVKTQNGPDDIVTKPIDKYEIITISAQDIGKPPSYNWYDANGELVYEGKDYTIDSAVAAKYNLQVINLVEGINNYKEVELIYKPNRLIAMYPNPANQLTTLNYKLNEADSAYILVASYYGTNSATNVYMVNLETNETTIDVGNFNTGLYLVALVVNNNIADMKILSKN